MREAIYIFDKCGFRSSWIGLVRIFIWTALFLILAGELLPERSKSIPFTQNTKASGAIPMLTLPNDPAFVRDDITAASHKGGEGLKIAWIGASSNVIYKPGTGVLDFAHMNDNRLLPVEVLKYIKNAGLENASMEMYLRLSMRMLENYTLSAIALDRKPDVIVITINPFFVFNNHAVYKGKNHLFKAASVWPSHREAWGWLPLFISPSKHLWAHLGRRFKVLGQAPQYAPVLAAFNEDVWRNILPRLKLPQGEGRSAFSDAQEALKENSQIYWVVFRLLKGDIGKIINDRNEVVNSLWYRQIIRLSNPDESTINYVILLDIISMIKQSGVSAVLYLAPLSPAMERDGEAWQKYQDIKTKLEEISHKYGDNKIHIITDIPEDYTRGIKYVAGDDMHMQGAGKLHEFIAREIMEAANNGK